MELETRKLYVGGLPPTTQQDEVTAHFSQYGEVQCVRVVRDHDTGLGRGFAFVDFADDEGPRAALKEEEKGKHVFGGLTVDVKRARVKPTRYQSEQPFYLHHAYQSPIHNQWYNQSSSNSSYTGNGNRGSDPYKVFVGGLRSHITKEDLKGYFEKFGTITDVVVIHDGLTQKPRGFGFITFDSEEAMTKVLKNSYHYMNGTRLEAKMAIPRDRTYDQYRRQHSPMIWRGSSYPGGYDGVYPPPNMQYIIHNHYMFPFQQYMFSPHTLGDYGYMANGSASPSSAARQGTPVYTSYETHFGYDSLGTNSFDVYNGSDSKVTVEQSADIQEANISNKDSLNLESKNIP